MTDDYNEKNTADNTQREINMIEKGKQRFERRNAKKSLDQTKVGIDIISLQCWWCRRSIERFTALPKSRCRWTKSKMGNAPIPSRRKLGHAVGRCYR